MHDQPFLHKQNNELAYVPDPLVEENCFIGKPAEDKPLPVFDEVRDRLPQPVWENHQDYLDCYWKAWQLAFGNLGRPTPGSGFVSNFIDTAFNGCLFMWDSSFILMFGKYADRIFPFQKTLDNLYAHQHKDGFICREIHEETGMDRFVRHDPNGTGPDVMPWCEWEYFRNFGDLERLAQVFPPLMAYHHYMAEHHTWPDGTYFSTGWGCGMDNIPRVQPGYNVSHSHSHMIWVDACMQELNDCHILMEMAKILGREEYIPELEAEQERLRKVINEKLWDEETGFYYDLWHTGEHNMVRHVGAFWALLAGCASEQQAERLCAHLQDEKEFKTPVRVPALSRSSEYYCPDGGYWRGGVWAPTTYMVLKGLDNYGRYALAHEIGRNCLDAVVSVFKDTGTLFENYAPELNEEGKPVKGNPAAKDFVGWTGLPPIAMLFEYVFGLKPDAAHGRILWDVRLLEKHGVEKYPLGTNGELALMCEKRQHADEEPQVTVKSNIPVEVEIRWGDGCSRIIRVEP